MRPNWVIVALVLCTGSGSAAACFEPTAPYCAERYGAFDDEWDFDRCKREMNSFRDEVESYISCVSDEAADAARRAADEAADVARRAAEEAQRQSQQAIDEYQSAVDSFNRRAGG